MKPKPRVPLWRWALWWVVLVVALVVFYGFFTPFWMSTRALAWLVDFRARRKPGYRAAVSKAASEGPGAPAASDKTDP